MLFWFKLHLYGDIYLCTSPQAVTEGLRSLQPALQYLPGELSVDEGLVLPLVASHNTVRMRFDIETADYLHLAKPDASFPHRHFSMLADERRCQVRGMLSWAGLLRSGRAGFPELQWPLWGWDQIVTHRAFPTGQLSPFLPLACAPRAGLPARDRACHQAAKGAGGGGARAGHGLRHWHPVPHGCQGRRQLRCGRHLGILEGSLHPHFLLVPHAFGRHVTAF